ARQHAPSEWAPWNQADAFRATERDHLALFLAIEEVVVVLHRDEARPAAALRRRQRLRESPRRAGARAEVADLASAYEVVQGLERLVDRHLGIEAVNLVEIDRLDAEPFQTGFAGLENVLAIEPAHVRARSHREVHLRRDDDLVARGHGL